jgi:hypothetical protein
MFWDRSKPQNSPIEHVDLAVEPLEDRRLLAGMQLIEGVTVDYNAERGTLKIDGDNTDNSVFVGKASNGNLEVSSSNANGTQFNSVVFADSSQALNKLTINMRGGHDTVTVRGAAGEPLGSENTLIKLGSGDDVLNYGGFHTKTRVVGGSGNDQVTIEGGSIFAQNNIRLGGGNDSMRIDIGKVSDSLVAELDGVFTAAFVSSLIVAESPPHLNVNLGGGDDGFAVTSNGYLVQGPIGNLELIVGGGIVSGFFGVQSANVTGGGGFDTLQPAGLQPALDLVGSVRSFEAAFG